MPPPPPRPSPAAAPRPGATPGATPGAVRRAGTRPSGGRLTPDPWMHVASATVISLLIILLAITGVFYFSNARLKSQLDKLPRLRLQSEMIKEAYAELAEQGAILKARLSQSDRTPEKLNKHIHAAARMTGIKVTIGAPKEIDNDRDVDAYRIVVTATAREDRILNFLLSVDALPAIVRIEEVQLTGVASGKVSLDLTLNHLQFTSRLAKRLKKFVEGLPAMETLDKPRVRLRRTGDLFLPVVLSEEAALQGWPKVMLSGFMTDRAFFEIEGEMHSVELGNTITGGIVYADKLAVNQALLKRQGDGAEIILTVGSRTYALKPHKARGMSEFVLTLQKRASSELLLATERP